MLTLKTFLDMTVKPYKLLRKIGKCLLHFYRDKNFFLFALQLIEILSVINCYNVLVDFFFKVFIEF